MFPYEYSLFELEDKHEYLIAFIPKNNITEDMLNLSFIKKFRFKSFDEDAYEEINSIKYSDYLNTKILNVIQLDGIIAVLSCNRSEEIIEVLSRRRILSSYYKYIYNLKFYNCNLNFNRYIADIELNNYLPAFYQEEEVLFFKSLYLEDNYLIFIYYKEYYYYSFIFDLFKFDFSNYKDGGNQIDPFKFRNEIPSNDIFGYINMNGLYTDLIKINNSRAVFIYAHKREESVSKRNLDNSNYNYILSIIIININKIKENFHISDFYIGFENYFPQNQILGCSYNGYLLFAASFIYRENDYSSNQNENYISVFIPFGYANGTDSIINISNYLSNNGNYQSGLNFYDCLNTNVIIENNIFGYIIENKINLLYIPQDISIYEIKENNENLTLTNNSLIYNDKTYELKENASLLKTVKYYYIDYQYIVKEKIINEETETLKRYLSSSSEEEDNSKIYYGRINRLKFKLCHEFCETFYELSTDNNMPNCLSCLDKYQYDYFYFTNNFQKEKKYCVPQGYYYINDTNTLIKCNNEDTKYYFNNTNKKEICFKIEYDCPYSYIIYNESLKECLQCDYEHYMKGECNSTEFIDCYKNKDCVFNSNDSLEDIYKKIKNSFIKAYNESNGYLSLNNGNDYNFEITSVNNEMNNLISNKRNNFSIIDFNNCAELLKREKELDPDMDLVLLKYENENLVSNGSEKSIQYEVFIPGTSEKLDLSICSNEKIDVYIPIEINEKAQKLYDELKQQGYNLFDKNDKFYNDICTPYETENGTDVLLSDRYNDFFIPNQLVCQVNCEFSDYLSDSKYLKCECSIYEKEEIEIKVPEKITAKSIVKTFYNTLKYSNYKVLQCYKLVFSKNTIKKNIGSILSNIYFIGYLISLGLFFYNKKLFYLKNEIKLLQKKMKNLNKNNYIINRQETVSLDIMKLVEENEGLGRTEKNMKNILKLKNNKIKFDKKILIEYKDNSIKPNEIIDLKNISSIKIIQSNPSQNIIDDNNQNNISGRDISSNRLDIKSPEPFDAIKFENNKSNEILSDFELNDLEYLIALKLDKRNFLKIYWYLLKREHLIIFTFFNRYDYNIFSIKLSKLFLAICTDMAFNVFFFSDESMHNIYITGGKYDYIGQLAQMIYSTIISQILQIILNYLSMTDIVYYQIKEILKEKNIEKKKYLFLIKCIKYKIIIFYSFSFLLFLFFWYLISAFCAVYENTQKIFITDSISSFIMGLIYPFVLYLIPAGLRIISLKAKEKKNLKYLYFISDKIPFF